MLLARLQVSPNGIPMHVAKVVRHQHRDFAAHHLGNRISEYPLRSLIDKEDDTSFVYGDDPVRRRFRDDAKESGTLKGSLWGINRSRSLRVPWFRHGRLIPCPCYG